MKINDSLLPRLHTLLHAFEEKRDALRAHNTLVVPAEAAVARLLERGEELERRKAELSRPHIPASRSRVSRLIAGENVEQLDAEAIKTRAMKAHALEAELRQLKEDAAAVTQHLTELRGTADTIRQDAKAAESLFLQALADAALDAYKTSAVAFVRQNLLPLQRAAVHLRERTGEGPEWANRVFNGVNIGWLENEKLPDPSHPGSNDYFIYKKTTIWPPASGASSVCGEHLDSDDWLEDSMNAIRSFVPAAAPQAAAG